MPDLCRPGGSTRRNGRRERDDQSNTPRVLFTHISASLCHAPRSHTNRQPAHAVSSRFYDGPRISLSSFRLPEVSPSPIGRLSLIALEISNLSHAAIYPTDPSPAKVALLSCSDATRDTSRHHQTSQHALRLIPRSTLHDLRPPTL